MNRRRLPLFYHRERSAAIGIGATVTFAPIASSLSLLAMTGKNKPRCGARNALEYRDGCLDFARNSK